MDKIAQIGSLTQETFVKNEFNPLKLDFDSYAIKTQYEDEEKERIAREKREAQAIRERKSSATIFREKMFSKEILKDLTMTLEPKLNASLKKTVNRQIDNNAWMKKLI